MASLDNVTTRRRDILATPNPRTNQAQKRATCQEKGGRKRERKRERSRSRVVRDLSTQICHRGFARDHLPERDPVGRGGVASRSAERRCHPREPASLSEVSATDGTNHVGRLRIDRNTIYRCAST